MDKIQKYLIDNDIDNIVLNENEYPLNTPKNAGKWVYLSDVIEQYLTHIKGQSLPIDSVIVPKGTSPICECKNTERQDYGDGWNITCLDCGQNW